ncbi:hypothetical protein K7432_010609 [Basidiobolus ranarum]|uniref:NmrA-like domain-containing protein n=1 Tax=Basidiobolus ranarum TaxID=34480 RepID=A0ABR2WNI1_9FUNG
MVFAIVGASGQTGSACVDTLLSQGKKVRVLIRRPELESKFLQKGCEVAVGSLTDLDFVTSAFQGTEGVYLYTPPTYDQPDFLSAAQNIIDICTSAVIATKPKHVVVLSTIGGELSEGTGVIVTGYLLERSLLKVNTKETGVTIIRAATFMENFKPLMNVAREKGIFPSMFLPIEKKYAMIGIQDIGECAAEQLIAGPTGHKIVNLETSTRVSAQDFAKAIGKALHKDVVPIGVPQDQWKATYLQQGMPENVANGMVKVMKGFVENRIVFQEDKTTVYGKREVDEVVSSWL